MPARKLITKDTTVGQVVKKGEKYCDILVGFGMHCLGCPMSQMETLEQAANAHEIDLEAMLKELNK